MHVRTYIFSLALMAIGVQAAPLPLNINLGAYSPALVVGDGALTFDGGEEAGAAVAALQTVAPNEAALAKRNSADDGSYVEKQKRYLGGFDRALTFVETALVERPKIQLGTGEDGAGVGIMVENNIDAAARTGKGT
jgi:hypothetical protein